MTLLTKKKQLLAAGEAVGGVQATLDSTSGAEALDAQGGIEIESFDRDVASDSISRKKGIQGQKVGTLSFGLELTGTALGTFAAGEPEIARFLKACGFRGAGLSKLTISNIAHPGAGIDAFRHGETVTATPSGATGIVVGDVHAGSTTMYLRDVTGTFTATDTITGGSSTVTADVDSTLSADIGYGYWPVSRSVVSIVVDGGTGTASIGDVIEGNASGARAQVLTAIAATTPNQTIQIRPIRGVFSNAEQINNLSTGVDDICDADAAVSQQFLYGGTLSTRLNEDGVARDLLGARGNVAFDFQLSRPVRANFTFRGAAVLPYDLPTISGLTFNKAAQPPLWVGTAAAIAQAEDAAYSSLADEIIPCITSMGIDIGNQLSDRKCASALTGLQEIIIANRLGSGSLDPEATFEADIPWLGNFFSGETVRLRNTIGTALGNQFIVQMPALQYENVPSGDRNGILTRDVTFKMTSGTGTALIPNGGDNELVLIYLTNG